ncbi:putative protein kinase/phosphatase [Streptomyces sp. NBRC 110611]|nr:putative protein kinase/phosphatase [Streptomyces sp. NBRC 110611]
MFALHFVVVLLLIAAVTVQWVLIARDGALEEAGERSLAAAQGFANAPGVAPALRSADPTAVLQPQAEAVRRRADVDFLVVMNRDGIRYTSPTSSAIGQKFIGTIGPALAGRPVTERLTIECCRNVVQAVVPIMDSGNKVVGLVSAGVRTVGVSGYVSRRLPFLFTAAAVALAIGIGGTALISRRLRRQTHGQGPAQLARMYGDLKLLYNASTSIGTTLEVKQTAQELARVAVPAYADFVTVDLAERVVHGDEPAVDGSTELLRTAVHGTRSDHPFRSEGQRVTVAPSTPQAQALSTGQAGLLPDLQTAQAWKGDGRHAEQARKILDHGIHSAIVAPLTARGVALGIVTFWRSRRAEPFAEDDLAVAGELAARAAVSLDNARRYTREHSMAVTLQRSLLPRALPEQNAVDVASGYLPAPSGVRGDWFDVIALPGFRVALVVGDVVGHGLHATATMGRLRTTVHNFSALDLPPDELLASLDELVSRIDQAETDTTGGSAITGATCLYAIYDSASGRCTLARAGHPVPALVSPDGEVTFPEVPAGPPLGVGGLPFETTELQLPEGSTLALYTDGLFKDRGRDIAAGAALLRDTLAAPGRTSQETCQEVLQALRPAIQGDDIALLVARTRLLEPGRIADWDIPKDPSAVAAVREAAAEKLADWGLDDISFTTELILSELITNAVRYAAGPIHLRMLLDRSLVCEVSDASSTAPHLRYAATTDEGGRGIFLVAQLADRWGTRYTATGKVIWSEQMLP